MQPTSISVIRGIVAVIFCSTLAIAAFSDIKARRIPNWTVLCIAVLALAWNAAGSRGALVSAFESGGIALAASALLYAFGLVGAGDSKLFSATAFFLGLQLLPLLAVVTAMAGGVLAVAVIVANPRRALATFHMRGKGSLGDGIPYGVAIAIAAVLVVTGVVGGATGL